MGVRAQLALLYAAALAVIVSLYSLGLYALFRENLVSELDRQLRGDVELAEEELDGLIGGRSDARERSSNRERWLLEVWDAKGARRFSDPALEEGSPLGSPPSSCGTHRIRHTSSQLPDGFEVRVACREVELDGQRFILRAARSGSRVANELGDLRWMMTLALPAIVLLSALCGYLLAWRVLRPVRRMTEQARQISANRLAERLDVPNARDELGKLASTFNETFARLERSFEQMRRFTSDASHELRTPLAAIRALGEVALNRPPRAEADREALASILEEADSLRHLVESLLTLSRADAGQVALQLKPVPLSRLVSDVVERLSVLAEDRQQVVEIETESGVVVIADAAILGRAITNLVDNALKFSPEGARIAVRVASKDGVARVEVEDAGPGIPAEHQPKVFERFYRMDEGRTRNRGGTGLGLAIARWAVEAHGGSIHVASDGRMGSRFYFSLPLAAALP